MSWRALIDSRSGRAVSIGTVFTSPLPAGLTLIPLAGAPRQDEMWDAATRTMAPRPRRTPRDLAAEIVADARVQALLPAVRSAVLDAAASVLDAAGRRYQ